MVLVKLIFLQILAFAASRLEDEFYRRSLIKWFPYSPKPSYIAPGDDGSQNMIILYPVPPTAVNFTFVDGSRPDVMEEYSYKNPKYCSNPEGKMYFIVHGWLEHAQKTWYKNLTAAILTAEKQSCVVQVDWSAHALKPYSYCVYYIEGVGDHIAKIMIKLQKKNISVDKIVVIGHGLGGQVASWAGKMFNEKTNRTLSRLIALDPAGPIFSTRPEDLRLSWHDADVVHVIHTDGDKLGMGDPCGTIDFYPNGGKHQVGCEVIEYKNINNLTSLPLCDHQRSWEYMIEAIGDPNGFMAKKCSNWDEFKANRCDGKSVSLGDLNTKEKGNFYLETNTKAPFAKKVANNNQKGVEL